MTRVHEIQDTVDVTRSNDASFDSVLTKSAASMLESVEAYLSEHPDLNGWGRIPARSERSMKVTAKLEA